MITAGIIRNGARYLSHHLSKNDYWAEGEKQVQGEWVGLGAVALGLTGVVDVERFDDVRCNRHPVTGERLTARADKDRVAFFDVQLSAPKDVSVLAMVGGDDRVTDAFRASVKIILSEMERFAAVRERRGAARNTEKFRLTGNFAAGLFFHDASRDLDPQLHAHVVLGNATWDTARKEWFALQPAEMLRASVFLRQALYREIAGRLRGLGYEVYDMNSNGFSIRGVEHLRERFSKRAHQLKNLEAEFAQKKGRHPTKKESEILVRESRARKLTEVTTGEVRARQRAQLDAEEIRSLRQLVGEARGHFVNQTVQSEKLEQVLSETVWHVFERKSVVREGEFLGAALELHPEFNAWRELREALVASPDTLYAEGELTLRSVHREEWRTVERFKNGMNTRFRLGRTEHLSKDLTPRQKAAAEALIESKDLAVVLIGDAGTGKTTVLKSIEAAHLAAGGSAFIALAPTTRARDGLVQSGFEQSVTVQRFLANETEQNAAVYRTLLVDEAGLLSMGQLHQLSEIAEEKRARLLLVGDTKQHYSVERGDALRNVIDRSGTTIVRLSEVLRQRREPDRRFSRMLAQGEVLEAFDFAQSRGFVREMGDDATLFRRAAEHYANNLTQGIETLVVMPFWEEIARFNTEARVALRARGLLGQSEVVREAVRPLTWTQERKAHWAQYEQGDQLLFVRDTRYFRRGTSAEVVGVLTDGLRVARPNGRFAKITRRQCSAFDVGRRESLPLSVGDRLLIRGAEDSQGFANGDFKTVEKIDSATNEVFLNGGKLLPISFRAWTHGHALTSYRAQGSTAEESLVVLGEVAERALTARQFYVGNTRYRGHHHIYVSHRAAIVERLAQSDPGRETATEFLLRRGMNRAQEMAMRPLQRLGQRIQNLVWHAIQGQRQRQEETMRQNIHH